MQMGPIRVAKAPNFATRQDEPLNGPPIPRTAFETIAKMDRTDLVLVASSVRLIPLSPMATSVI
jgi:hypothetical protein